MENQERKEKTIKENRREKKKIKCVSRSLGNCYLPSCPNGAKRAPTPI